MSAPAAPPELIERIREAYQRTGSTRKTARECGCSEGTVAKYRALPAQATQPVANGTDLPRGKHETVTVASGLPDAHHESYEAFKIDTPGSWLILSDIHVPYHDRTTLELAVAEAKRRGVVGVLLNGDTLDSHEISNHDREPSAPRYIDEVDTGRRLLAWLRSQFPKSRIVLKEGNHEERLSRYIIQRAPALFGLEGIDLPGLMHFKDYGAEWVTDKRVIALGKLCVVHGHEYRGGGGVMPARWLYLRAKYVSMCFPAGTTVLCRDGIKPIKTVRVGDEALTHTGEWKPVVALQRRHAERTVTLRGHGHPGITTTPEHPFLSRTGIFTTKGTRSGFTEPEWTEAASMEGNYWSSPCEFPAAEVPFIVCGNGHEKPVVMSEPLMRLVGRWLGDGWVSKHKVEICCSHAEAAELEAMFADAGFDASHIRNRTTSLVSICRQAFANWLTANFGHGAAGKTLPAWALGMHRAYREALLAGYLSADGHEPDARGTPDWECCTVSRTLAVGIKLLAQSLGYSTTLYHETRAKTCQIEGRTVNQRDRWRVKGVKEFARWSSAVRQDGHLYGRVKEVTGTEGMEVFNLTVEGDSSYIADGLVVHNCGHFHRSSEHGERNIRGTEERSWSLGCACFLYPRYMPLNSWNHGFALVELSADGMFSVENKRILHGKVV